MIIRWVGCKSFPVTVAFSQSIKTGQTSHYHYSFFNLPYSLPLVSQWSRLSFSALLVSTPPVPAWLSNLIQCLRWYWSTFGPSAQDKPLGYRGTSVLSMTWHYRHTEILSSSSLVSMISSTPPALPLTSRTSQLLPRSRVTYLQMTVLPRL
jgi:hypothetical protein